MDVDPHATPHKAEHQGHPYYFCSVGCRSKFLAEPARYVASATVKVVGGVFTTRGIIFGKVFVDKNRNRVQNRGEDGIPGVRIWLEDGTFAVTGCRIGVGCAHTGQTLTLIRDGDHATVYTADGDPLGHTTLQPGKHYQPLTRPPPSPATDTCPGTSP